MSPRPASFKLACTPLNAPGPGASPLCKAVGVLNREDGACRLTLASKSRCARASPDSAGAARGHRRPRRERAVATSIFQSWFFSRGPVWKCHCRGMNGLPHDSCILPPVASLATVLPPCVARLPLRHEEDGGDFARTAQLLIPVKNSNSGICNTYYAVPHRRPATMKKLSVTPAFIRPKLPRVLSPTAAASTDFRSAHDLAPPEARHTAVD